MKNKWSKKAVQIAVNFFTFEFFLWVRLDSIVYCILWINNIAFTVLEKLFSIPLHVIPTDNSFISFYHSRKSLFRFLWLFFFCPYSRVYFLDYWIKHIKVLFGSFAQKKLEIFYIHLSISNYDLLLPVKNTTQIWAI